MGLNDYFTFGGADCSDFNVYASGEATFNSPVKEYDTYEVPGRSGDLKIFSGRYSNIKVVYPCSYEMVGSDFSKDISDLSNALLAQDGYQRLWDSHHPDEYRMGVYDGGLEVDPTTHTLRSGFDVEFDCKPQRYLTSGEVPMPVSSGGRITNPTLFNASPLLAVRGYGNIVLNGLTINIGDYQTGRIRLLDQTSNLTNDTLTGDFITSRFNSGDTASVSAEWRIEFSIDNAVAKTLSVTALSVSDDLRVYGLGVDRRSTDKVVMHVSCANYAFSVGTVANWTKNVLLQVAYTDTDTETATTGNIAVHFGMAFAAGSVSLTGITLSTTTRTDYTYISERKTIGPGFVESTKSALGDPLYIDLEHGEAYKYEDGEYVLVNYGVTLGTQLPVLSPGVNEITYSNTITELLITPRWWRL